MIEGDSAGSLSKYLLSPTRRQGQDTDHVESLPGRVERVCEFPVQRSAEGEDQEAGGVQEVEAQQDGEVPQEAIRTSD